MTKKDKSLIHHLFIDDEFQNKLLYQTKIIDPIIQITSGIYNKTLDIINTTVASHVRPQSLTGVGRNINGVLEHTVIRLHIVGICAGDCISTSTSESAGAAGDGQLPLWVPHLIPADNTDGAPIELSRLQEKVEVHVDCPDIEVSGSGEPLRSGDFLGVDVRLRRHAVVEHVDLAEACGGGGGDGSTGHAV